MKCKDCEFFKHSQCHNVLITFYLMERGEGNTCKQAEKARHCANCFYWMREQFDGGMICCNGASEHVADWTTVDMCCTEWEERKK